VCEGSFVMELSLMTTAHTHTDELSVPGTWVGQQNINSTCVPTEVTRVSMPSNPSTVTNNISCVIPIVICV
jgi:hypothetical protein